MLTKLLFLQKVYAENKKCMIYIICMKNCLHVYDYGPNSHNSYHI